jgi:uracil-DNA glycosylase family 4
MTEIYVRELCGRSDEPELGPVLTSSLDGGTDTAIGGIDTYTTLEAMLHNPWTMALPDGSGPGVPYNALLQPGHVGYYPKAWYGNQLPKAIPLGPSPGCADIVVVGKMPWDTEQETNQLFSGDTGYELKQALHQINAVDLLDSAYFTNVCRFKPPSRNLKASWIKECAWFLWAEVNIIRPRYLLLLGSDAIKFFHGRRASVRKMRGAFSEVECGPDHVNEMLKFTSFSTIHPAEVARDPGNKPGFQVDLNSFTQRVRGGTKGTYKRLDYRIIHNLQDLRHFVAEMVSKNITRMTVDCEWQGSSVHDAEATLLTVQVSWGEGTGACIVLNRHKRKDFHDVVDAYSNVVSNDTNDYAMVKVDLRKNKSGPMETRPAVIYRPKHLGGLGTVIELLDEFEPAYSGSDYLMAIDCLRELFLRPDVELCAHSIRADYPWLKSIGVDCIKQFLQGYDTMLAHHLMFETMEQNLKTVALRYTDMGRYDFKLTSWIATYVGDEEELKGYGIVPEGILYLYGIQDVDATFRIWNAMVELMSQPENVRLESLRVHELESTAGIAEIEDNGLLADRDRIIKLAKQYEDKRDTLAADFQKEIQWPDFNFRSVNQVRELLFGEALNGVKRDDPNIARRLRPEGAVCLNLQPVKTTGKPSKDWSLVIEKGLERTQSPSTDAESLGILSADNELADKLRKIRFVDQICKNFLSTNPDKGFLKHIDPDGRIRTSVVQLLETGRWASRSPNLQNCPKAQEPVLHQMFRTDEQPEKIRSVFMAAPGCVLVEMDYQQAELFTLAMLSGCKEYTKVLTESIDILCAKSTENGKIIGWLHPDWVNLNTDVVVGSGWADSEPIGRYRNAHGEMEVLRFDYPVDIATTKWKMDLHAETAITGFQMPYCAVFDGPGKGYVSHVAPERRVAAKAVNFGVNYGQAAPALYRGLRQQGVAVDLASVENMIRGFFQRYQGVQAYMNMCRESVVNPGYMENPFGRRRRFYHTQDRGIRGKQEREAMNFPIQSTVADVLNRAVYNFWAYRKFSQFSREVRAASGLEDVYKPCDYRICLGVHDALIFEVPYASVETLIEHVGPLCMTKLASVPATSTSPSFSLETDADVMFRWGEKPDPNALASAGIPEKYWPRDD